MSFSCLNSLLHVPPGGWKYVQPQSGFEVHGGDFYDLVAKIRKHRLINQFVTGANLELEVQEQLCSGLSAKARASFCRDCEAPASSGRALALDDVKHFLRVAKEWMVAPSFVSDLEATRRAEICAGCPKNVPIAGCRSCQNLVKWTIELIGHRSTPFDTRLGACEVCGCGNQAQVHLPLSALEKGITPEMEFPSFCWKATSRD